MFSSVFMWIHVFCLGQNWYGFTGMCHHMKNSWFHGKRVSIHQICSQNPVNSRELIEPVELVNSLKEHVKSRVVFCWENILINDMFNNKLNSTWSLKKLRDLTQKHTYKYELWSRGEELSVYTSTLPVSKWSITRDIHVNTHIFTNVSMHIYTIN